MIKDVPKTLVYELCRYRNTQAVLEGLPGPIPDSVLDKPPSAELRPDQHDDQSLPPTRSSTRSCRAMSKAIAPPRTSWRRVSTRPSWIRSCASSTAAEYKRRQMPPGVRITTGTYRQGPPDADHQSLPLVGH